MELHYITGGFTRVFLCAYLLDCIVTQDQARRQDLAAGGPKTRRRGHIFKIQYWMYVATGGQT